MVRLFAALTLPCPETPLVSETTWFHRHYTLVTWAMPVLFLALCLACALLPDRPSGPAGRGKIH